jgi:SHOCT-like domain
MQPENERMHILDMIEEGRITADEGLSLLRALNSEGTDEQVVVVGEPLESPGSPLEPGLEIPLPNRIAPISLPETDHPPAHSLEPGAAAAAADMSKWKRWWMVPLWIGVGITVFGGLFMYLAQQTSGIGFWFFCASVPFALGLVVIVLAWQSRTAPWLHVRVQQRPGEKPERIAFSFPLPVALGAWFIRTFGRYIPGMQDQDWGQVIEVVGRQTTPDNPIYIQVDEEEDGEKVEIYIG